MTSIRKTLVGVVAMMAATLPVKAQYTITGEVTGVEDGSKLFLSLVGSGEYQRLDSTIIRNGRFVFKGPHQERPRWALVQVDKQFSALCDFYLEDGDISITGSRYATEAHGTPTNDQNEEYRRNINSLFNDLSQLNFIKTQDPSAERRDSAALAMKEVEAEQQRREEAFVRKYPSSVVSGEAIKYRARSASSKQILHLLSLLVPEMQQTPDMLKVKSQAESLAKTEGGAAAPAFTLPAEDGREVSLSDFRGKYLLLDFWASWCSPCRASFPEVARISEKYKPKGVVVVGISLDRTEKPWRKALAEENATWLQLWDKDGNVGRDYAIRTIPHMILISPDGHIVGSYSKADLDAELKKVVGE